MSDRGPAMGEDRKPDEVDLLGRMGLTEVTLNELDKRELWTRLEAADAEGLAHLLGIDRKRGLDLIKKRGELRAGSSERSILRTPDARRLAKDLLSLFSENAAGDLVTQKLRLRAATLDPDLIREELALADAGSSLLGAIRSAGKLDQVRVVLKAVKFERVKPGTTGISAYFSSRAGFLSAAESLLRILEGVDEAERALPADKRASLTALLKTLGELEGGAIGDAEAELGDAEVSINEELRRGRADADSARRVVERSIEGIVSSLRMNAREEEGIRKAAMEGLRIPFEFERAAVRDVLRQWRQRQEEELARRRAKAETILVDNVDLMDEVVSRVLTLDESLAVALSSEKYNLSQPVLGAQGEGFVDGRNPFLIRDSGGLGEVRPVSYSLGRTLTFKVARPRNVAVLTGANSGGKTTLLTTFGAVHILTLFGLPVPCVKAEVVPVPIYMFRKRVTRRIGSLEHALSSLIPVFGDRRRKLVLIDEFEALTEPGAAGRIMASVLNEAATGSSLVLVVTHLARETLPHVRLPIRVDGIEAKGLSPKGDLLVDRQPIFGHIGSSMPKLIIMKLARSTKNRKVRALYEDILASIKEEKVQVQAPISTPWVHEEDD